MAEIVRPGQGPSLLDEVEGAERLFLSGRRSREADLESAVKFFLEFLRGFESFDFTEPCVTVFGSARIRPDHEYYELARRMGSELARAGYAVMTGGGPGIMEAANRGAREAGGFGTLDEAFEVATLIQTGKLDRFPIVGMGLEFWTQFRKFVRETMLETGVISRDDISVVYPVDSVEQAIEVIRAG